MTELGDVVIVDYKDMVIFNVPSSELDEDVQLEILETAAGEDQVLLGADYLTEKEEERHSWEYRN